MTVKITTKRRISISIRSQYNDMLEKISQRSGKNKSSLIEYAVRSFLEEQLAKDAEALSHMTFEDVPSEEEWGQLGSSLLS